MHDHPLWANPFRPRPPWRTEAARLFRSTPLGEGLSPRTVRDLTGYMHLRQYRPGEPVFSVGDPGLGMYLILEGEVEITLEGRTLALLSAGDFFGEVALFGEETRTASALARDACRLAGFFRPDLDEWLAREPRQGARLLMNLGRLLAERLRRSNARLSRA